MIKSTRLLLIAVTLLMAQPAHSSTVRQTDLGTLLALAELVFEGVAVSAEARWNTAGNRIHTFVIFDVKDVIKGQHDAAQLTLRFSGGMVGNDEMRVDGSLLPVVGEKGIYFVESTSKKLINPLLGWSQGHFLLEQDLQNVDRVMTANKAAVMALDNPSQQRRSRFQPFSNGVASGISISRGSGARSTAMSKQAFKDQLRARLSVQRSQ